MSSTETGNQDRPLTVSVKRARELLDVGHTTMWALIRDQKLETVSIGRKPLVIFNSLEGLVADLRASKREVA